MSRNTRRGKGIRDQSQLEEVTPPAPSKLLYSILKTLDLTFEKDIGMLNGKYVRSVPDKLVLLTLKEQLEKLDQSLVQIAKSDQEVVDIIRETRDNIRKKKEFEDDKSKDGGLSRDKYGSADVKDISSKNKDTYQLGGVSSSSPFGNAAYKDFASKGRDKFCSNGADYSNPSNRESLRKKVGMKEGQNDYSNDSGSGVPQKRQTVRKRSSKLTEDEDGQEQSLSGSNSPANINKRTKIDTDRIENDPNVKNPKSEFVVSQTLPAAAIQLGLFTDQGLESTGDEYLRKKYAVASYPATDLKDLLPGELPDMDFSRPKPTNQIQYNTFLSSVDNFFREFSDDDIKFLQTKYIIPQSLQVQKKYDPEVTPYVIPKLGHLYTDTWLKEDNNQNVANLSPPPVSDPSSILPKKSANEINDDILDNESVSCGPLVSRLLSAILKDDGNESRSATKDEHIENGNPTSGIVPEDDVNSNTQEIKSETNNNATPLPDGTTNSNNNANSNSISNNNLFDDIKLPTQSASSLPQQQGWKASNVKLDYTSFEERLKRELKYVGIYMSLPKDENGTDDPDWLNGKEDDEISAELRELQSALRQVTKRNEQRKAILVPLLEKQLAWQEYVSILDDLDKQVDQAYIKRIRVPKNKKKKHSTTNITSNPTSTSQAAIQAAHQQAANSSLKSLLDKRQRWISNIGPLFDKPEKMKRIPKESVFRDLDQDEEEEDADVFGGNGNSKDEEDLGTDSLQK